MTLSPTVWIVLLSTLLLVGGVGIAVSTNRRRFERRLADEMRALVALAPSSIARPSTVGLPAPVERYRLMAVGDRAPVRSVVLRHGGTFRMSPTARALPIRGIQVLTADPPGFVWTGRIQMVPGLWVDARDMSVEGEGSMRVLIDDTITLADVRGPHLDTGAALRLLAEMVWYPTSLFDVRSVTWSAIDAGHARATLRIGSLEVAGIFEFGADSLPSGFTAERFNDKGELLRWGGTYRDYRAVSGMRVPFEADVTWQLASGPFTYAHWLVDAMEYDEPLPAEPGAALHRRGRQAEQHDLPLRARSSHRAPASRRAPRSSSRGPRPSSGCSS